MIRNTQEPASQTWLTYLFKTSNHKFMCFEVDTVCHVALLLLLDHNKHFLLLINSCRLEWEFRTCYASNNCALVSMNTVSSEHLRTPAVPFRYHDVDYDFRFDDWATVPISANQPDKRISFSHIFPSFISMTSEEVLD